MENIQHSTFNAEQPAAGAIIDALHQAGATLVVEDGKARVRGVKVPDELLAALREHKVAVLAEWSRRQEENRDRYGKVPTGEVAMFGRDIPLTHAQTLVVTAYAFRQPRPVHAWVMGRASEYHALGVPLDEQESMACVDLLCWQRNHTAKAALEWLAAIEECATNLPKKQTEKPAAVESAGTKTKE
jgi:hypothetical protein